MEQFIYQESLLQEQFLLQNLWVWVLVGIVVWTLPWKGYALWKAARATDKWWFIALLLINTVGLLEILYIFLISKRKKENI